MWGLSLLACSGNRNAPAERETQSSQRHYACFARRNGAKRRGVIARADQFGIKRSAAERCQTWPTKGHNSASRRIRAKAQRYFATVKGRTVGQEYRQDYRQRRFNGSASEAGDGCVTALSMI